MTDAGCLIGLCAAMAQEAVASAPAESSTDKDLSLAVVWIGIALLLAAQLAAPLLLRLYRRSLQRMRGSTAERTLGRSSYDPRWDADALLASIARRRRAVLNVLVVVVALYSLSAGWLYAYDTGNPAERWLSVAVSALMFLAFSWPVVLLGVSATNFARNFWTWFAPGAFAAVAMQIIIAGYATDQNKTPEEAFWALGGAVLLTGLGVVLRETVPAERWQKLAAAIRRHRWKCGIAILLVLVLLWGWIAYSESTKAATLRNLLVGCSAAALAITLLYFAMVDRVKRIVVPLLAMSLFAILAVLVIVAMVLSEVQHGGALWLWMRIGLGVALAGACAYLLLGWIALAHEKKVFSEAQFQVYCWLCSVGGVVIFTETLLNKDVDLSTPVNRYLLLTTLGAMGAYALLTRLIVKPLHSNKRLLVLRVFAPDGRREGLLDELEYRWRFIGPIVLIGASDFAARTIDPAKAANFIRLRFGEVFVPTRRELRKRIAAMDEAPDPDGRYRVNEFFCFDDVWKEAVTLLLDSSEAIVLDLRDFTAQRAGTAWEIGLLARHRALSRTVCLVSADTDLEGVRAALGLSDSASATDNHPMAAAMLNALGRPAHQRLSVDLKVMSAHGAKDGERLVERLVRCIPAEDLPELDLHLKPPALAA
jgi:hypothetical protein